MTGKSDTDDRPETEPERKVLDYNEVRYSSRLVREDKADGTLYAYRDGDEHVVVSQGRQPETQWTKRVPAKRQAVFSGEQLWTIPDNWTPMVAIKGHSGRTEFVIYRIPDTDVDVLVSNPVNSYLVDKWYKVKRIGELAVTYGDWIDWDGLNELIEYADNSDDVSEEVVKALKTLHKRRNQFEKTFANEVNMYAEDALFQGKSPERPVTVKQWGTDPWEYIFEVDDIVQDFLDLDDKTTADVLDLLKGDNIIPSYPHVDLDVEERTGLPQGYDILAMVESGASGAETIDYLVTEKYELMNQTEWATLRGTGNTAISKNVSGANRTLSN